MHISCLDPYSSARSFPTKSTATIWHVKWRREKNDGIWLSGSNFMNCTRKRIRNTKPSNGTPTDIKYDFSYENYSMFEAALATWVHAQYLKGWTDYLL
uniref:Uncharacterized protein n=1 Tax=Romanomermis culicivorax TaxID=13658 RepID=A0A915L233_ROMCU